MAGTSSSIQTRGKGKRKTEVIKAGETIVRESFEFPGGRRFHFTDPSGNELAVWSEA